MGEADPAKHREISSLDVLRAAAALAVLCVHAHQLFLLHGRDDFEWARAGDLGVPIFFVLSGYLIGESVLRGPTFRRSAFAIRRGARILPAYYVSVGLALLIWDPTPLLAANGRADVLAHLLLLHSVSRGMRYSIIGVWWTLSLEWMFYIWMLLVGSAFRRQVIGWILAAAMVALGPVWRHLAWSTDGADTLYRVQQFPGVADLFGLGIVIALLLRTPQVRSILDRAWVRWGLATAAAAWMAAAAWVYDDRLPTYWRSTRLVVWWPTAFGLGVAVLVGCLAFAPSRVDRLAERSGLGRYGRISYGIFLFHPFVLGALARAWFPKNPELPAGQFLAVAIVGTSIIAAFIHITVERPAMAWSRRVTSRQT